MPDDLYATTEQITALRRQALRMGKPWETEVSNAMRGERMFRSRYERVSELMEKATAALEQYRNIASTPRSEGNGGYGKSQDKHSMD